MGGWKWLSAPDVMVKVIDNQIVWLRIRRNFSVKENSGLKRLISAILGTGVGFGVGYGIGLLGEAVAWEEPTAPAYIYILAMIISAVLTGIMTKKAWLAALVFFCIGLPCIGGAIAQGGSWSWTEFSNFSLFYLLLVVMPFAALGGVAGYAITARRVRPPTPVEERESAEESKAGFEEEQRRREEARARHEEEQRHREGERRRREEERRWREKAGARFERESGATETYYNILGVSRNATQDEIKRAYNEKSQKHHPDKFMDHEWARKKEQEIQKKLNEAYEVLGDPNKRKAYDKGL